MASIFDKVEWSLCHEIHPNDLWYGDSNYDVIRDFFEIIDCHLQITFILLHCKDDNMFDCSLAFEYDDKEIFATENTHLSEDDIETWIRTIAKSMKVMLGHDARILKYL